MVDRCNRPRTATFIICIEYIPLLYYVTIFYVPPPPPQPRLFIAEFTRYLYSEAEIPH